MKRTALLALALLALSACAPAPRLPDGVKCTNQQLSTLRDVPDKANPDSTRYSQTYAMGFYLGYGCDVSDMAFPTFPD